MVIIEVIKIGKYCVIGANSIVIEDMLDFCVALGSPCGICKNYNGDTKNEGEYPTVQIKEL